MMMVMMTAMTSVDVSDMKAMMEKTQKGIGSYRYFIDSEIVKNPPCPVSFTLLP
jgi:hypothetical protein